MAIIGISKLTRIKVMSNHSVKQAVSDQWSNRHLVRQASALKGWHEQAFGRWVVDNGEVVSCKKGIPPLILT